MALTPSFSINSVAQLNPASIYLLDTSQGSDVNVTNRLIQLYQTNGSLLTAAISWPYAQSSITISPLTQDIALNVVILWQNASGNTLYQAALIFAFTGYSEQFMYQLTQNQTSQPNIVQDVNYYSNKEQLRCELDAATQAINVGLDLFSAQSCIQRAQYLITNSNLNF